MAKLIPQYFIFLVLLCCTPLLSPLGMLLVNVKVIDMACQIKESGLYCTQKLNMNSSLMLQI